MISQKASTIRFRRIPILALAGLLAAGCTPAAPTVAFTSTPDVCRPSDLQKTSISFPEVQGDMYSDGELWALLFFDQAHAGQELKIVWRIDGGEGNPTVRAALDDGTTSDPIWGPEYHGSSTWDRPGEEWGTGFNFPTPGCWTITVTRGEASGEIRLDVLPSQ